VGTQSKPGMFCSNCDRPVVAQREMREPLSNAARSVLSLGTSSGTVGSWYCPHCGGRVVSANQGDSAERFGLWVRSLFTKN
jgi:hypothetical protein